MFFECIAEIVCEITFEGLFEVVIDCLSEFFARRRR